MTKKSESNVIFGPPGTGKTTALIEGVSAELARGTDPERIAYLSFTRTAAHVARDRARAQFNLPQSAFKWFRTIHSLAFNQLGIGRDSIMTLAQFRIAGKELGLSFSRSSDDVKARVKDGDDFYITHMLMQSTGLDYWALKRRTTMRFWELEYKQLTKRLEKWKQAHGLYEFHDLLTLFLERCGPMDVDAVFIDEAQDLSALQWRMINHAFAHVPRRTVAGDDDQSLYDWCGADVRAFLGQPGTQRVLARSYRVPENLRSYVNQIAGRIPGRKQKDWHGTDVPGKIQHMHHFHEVKFRHADTEDYLVLARHSCFLEDMSAELTTAGRLHYLHDKLNIDEKVLAGYEQLWRISAGERIPVHRCKELILHSTGRVNMRLGDVVGPEQLEKLEPMWRVPEGQRRAVRVARAYYGNKIPRTSHIRLKTIHTSKGMEAENVIVSTAMTRASGMRPLPESEDRAFYVAATRASKRLAVIHSNSPQFYPMPF